MSFPFERLRRAPDIEGEGLVAADAADRLILDESAALRTAAGPGEIVVIGDGYGALALGAAFAGARDVRVHQDALSGERALAANAQALGLDDRVSSGALDAALVSGARVVLLRLPRALDALRDIAGLIAAHAASDVVVVAGGRLKHMTVAMNDVLRSAFDTLDVTHARQKSRVLIARVLAQDTPVILADEPVAGLDPAHQIGLMEGLGLLAREGRLIVVSLHELGLAAQFCTRLILLDKGRIVDDGQPQDVLTAERLREIYGIEAHILQIGGQLVVQPKARI